MAKTAYTEWIPRPSADSVNKGLTYCPPSTLRALLGEPRPANDYNDECKGVSNPKLAARIVTADVGPFRVTGERLAIESLKRIFAKVKAEKPDLYALLASAGMCCCRFIRGSHTNISNHSWGTAVDIEVGGVLDRMGDGLTLKGLLALYPYFHEEGWYWGVEFSREDGMHFEVAKETAERWYGENSNPEPVPPTHPAHAVLQLGSTGAEVHTLQHLLGIREDGEFGEATKAAVIKFQKKYSLSPDGIVGAATWDRLL